MGISSAWVVTHARTGIFYWFGVVVLGISLALVLVLAATFFLVPAQTFRREPKLREDVSWSFSPENIFLKTKDVDSEMQWSTFSMALIDSHSYLLFIGKTSFVLIPKRVFQDAEIRTAFEKLLLQQIPKIITK